MRKSYKQTSYTLLKNGLVVDGTGQKGMTGNVLINGPNIEEISRQAIDVDGEIIDCTGKVIAPGFIDIHSHQDWFLPSKEHNKFTSPFTSQGITTFIGGNCGFAPAGFKKDSPHKGEIEHTLFRFFRAGLDKLPWDSIEEYFKHLSREGISHNLSNFAGYNTTRGSIKALKPDPMRADEMKDLLWLLEEAMDQGAKGVSLGLQYEPGIFATTNELGEIARLVKRKNKIITVHAKALSALSGSYPLSLNKSHNLQAIQDMIDLARDTGVRLQFSHLIFVGTRTWGTHEKALELFDRAMLEGIDIKFDTYAHHGGASLLYVVLPEWFIVRAPEVYNNSLALRRLRFEMMFAQRLLGFGYGEMQVTYANHPELNEYNGMFLSDIASKRGLSPFENFIDFIKRGNRGVKVLMHKHSNQKIIEALMKHPASLFMTDAWSEPEGQQNPGAFGTFPRFLQLARDKKLLSLEETIHKMTGACASRVGIKDRGTLKEGLAADITVFDWNTIRDNTTVEQPAEPPTGIEFVFINGAQVLGNGKADGSLRPGVILI
ncbi:hypothetical protein B9J77_02650 [candidate division NPL-UPA2 bacterium Unc8]|uniref:Amidohydrolase 3 domain-containing protein n=1 Tax=candidate division NPL-UPA2 bacterium Unc8 TaxID=1980939 RepID=A0A399FW61_UNCN2|nr:D-aminoacylase [Bacillota bacterium]MBT9147490.1 D-aminoacylase [Bacillota bacterium]RII00401.1 MAG: hypothetical protein B9J77_02650 [candidate division NPL-UPA2 bacterium Unc8]